MISQPAPARGGTGYYFRPMNKNRLEAFSDGVIAIIITIMVLERRAPAGDSWAGLAPHSRLAAEVGRDAKGWISTGCYAAAIPLAWVNGGVLSDRLYVLVALIWLVPDRRMAAALGD